MTIDNSVDEAGSQVTEGLAGILFLVGTTALGSYLGTDTLVTSWGGGTIGLIGGGGLLAYTYKPKKQEYDEW